MLRTVTNMDRAIAPSTKPNQTAIAPPTSAPPAYVLWHRRSPIIELDPNLMLAFYDQA